MKKLLSSMFYQLARDGAMYRLTGLFVVALAVFGFVIGLTSDETPCAGRLIVDSPSLLWMFQTMLIAILTSTICAADFKDKDLYYELMAGHSRAELFFSKAVPATFLTALVACVLTFVPVISCFLIYGWGDLIEAGSAILRLLLFFFPYLRMSAFFTLIAFLCKKRIVCIALGYFAMCGGIFLNSVIIRPGSFLSCFFNLQDLCDFSTWSVYQLDPEKGIVNYTAYDSAIGSGLIVGTILISLLISAVYLLAGYGFFRRDDLD